MDSTPGFPLSRRFSTNQQALDECLEEIIDAAANRLMLLGTTKSPSNPVDIVRLGYRDLVSPFIKDEPHPSRKAKDSKWRIVSCVSLVDQLVERVLYHRAVDSVKARYPESSAVVGIGFSDENIQHFVGAVRKRLGNQFHGTDVSGWDRTLGATYTDESGEGVIRSCSNPYPFWAQAVRNHAHGISRPVFQVAHDTGTELICRPKPGGMLSGSFVTTLFNTLCRLDVSEIAGSTGVMAAGDDALEDFPPEVDIVQRYSDLGFTLRLEETFEFCSHVFARVNFPVGGTPHGCVGALASWPKAVCKFFSKRKVTFEHVLALQHELRHNGWEKDNPDPLWPKLKPYVDEALQQSSQVVSEQAQGACATQN